MLDWLKQHPGLVVSGGVSVVLLVAGVLLAPVAVARLPADFFSRENRKPSLWLNILGWVLIVAGAAMMVLPGPGAIALVGGIVLARFPGKRGFLRWLLAQGKIFEGLNRIRARRGKPPLERPRADTQPGAQAP